MGRTQWIHYSASFSWFQYYLFDGLRHEKFYFHCLRADSILQALPAAFWVCVFATPAFLASSSISFGSKLSISSPVGFQSNNFLALIARHLELYALVLCQNNQEKIRAGLTNHFLPPLGVMLSPSSTVNGFKLSSWIYPCFFASAAIFFIMSRHTYSPASVK
jgi:hypothetical protein